MIHNYISRITTSAKLSALRNLGRYEAKSYLTLTGTERIELKLEAPVRNVLINNICYYNECWYTIISGYDDSNKLDLKTISDRCYCEEC
jgi:hypothetical protein